MSNRIGVVFAPNRKNLGMYSVDLAGYQFLTERFERVDFLCQNRHAPGAFSYYNLHLGNYSGRGDLDAYDEVIFWGDFTTSPHFGWHDFYGYNIQIEHPWIGFAFRRGGLGYKRFSPRIFSKWAEMYLPADDGKKYYSVGQNFQIPVDPSPCNRDALSKFGFFEGVIPRDSVSFGKLEALQHGSGTDFGLVRGYDAALLLDSDKLFGANAPKPAAGRKPVLGVFLARSGLQRVKSLTALLEKDFEIRHFKRWLNADPGDSASFEKAIGNIRECDLFISDTYHFIINCLRERRPVIGLGVKAREQASTVGDFKKRVLFEDLGIPECYVGLDDRRIRDDEMDLIRGKLHDVDRDKCQEIAGRRGEFGNTVMSVLG